LYVALTWHSIAASEGHESKLDKPVLVAYKYNYFIRHYVWRCYMNSKLTLRLDEDLIQSAKSYSAKTGKSVSKIVADYFALIDKKLSGRQREISPLTRSLRGSLKKGRVSEEDYKKYLEEKYL